MNEWMNICVDSKWMEECMNGWMMDGNVPWLMPRRVSGWMVDDGRESGWTDRWRGGLMEIW